MADLALVTANFGGLDDMRLFPSMPGIDTFYYVDADTLSRTDPTAMSSWDQVIVPDYPRHDFEPRLRARYFKHQIHRLPEVEPYRWLAWADSSLLIKDAIFLLREAERLRGLAPRKRLALVPHPDRQTVRQEYEFISREIEQGNDYLRSRYADEKMPEQMKFFTSRGWNLDAKLWCGTIWLVENNTTINWCWDSWWDQNLRYGMMDQLSLPVLLDEFALEPQAMELNLRSNCFFDWGPHRHSEPQINNLSNARQRAAVGQKGASVLGHLDIQSEFQGLKRTGLSCQGDLCHLMTSFGSDKGSPFHNYTIAYDRLFAPFRGEPLTVFELGLGTNKVGSPSSMGPLGRPGASLRGWRA